MPYGVKKSGTKWVVYNKETGEIKSHHMSKAMAESSRNARQAGAHGWKPTRNR